MDEVLTQQAATEQEITVVDNTINDMKRLADVAAANATLAYNVALDTFNTAERLLDEAATPLDEVKANETKGKMWDMCQ